MLEQLPTLKKHVEGRCSRWLEVCIFWDPPSNDGLSHTSTQTVIWASEEKLRMWCFRYIRWTRQVTYEKMKNYPAQWVRLRVTCKGAGDRDNHQGLISLSSVSQKKLGLCEWCWPMTSSEVILKKKRKKNDKWMTGVTVPVKFFFLHVETNEPAWWKNLEKEKKH